MRTARRGRRSTREDVHGLACEAGFAGTPLLACLLCVAYEPGWLVPLRQMERQAHAAEEGWAGPGDVAEAEGGSGRAAAAAAAAAVAAEVGEGHGAAEAVGVLDFPPPELDDE